MKKPWNALSKEKMMWKARLPSSMTVAIPNPHVRPSSGVRIAIFLLILTMALTSWNMELPTAARWVLTITRVTVIRFTTTMARAGTTKARRALVMSQLSQQASGRR